MKLTRSRPIAPSETKISVIRELAGMLVRRSSESPPSWKRHKRQYSAFAWIRSVRVVMGEHTSKVA